MWYQFTGTRNSIRKGLRDVSNSNAVLVRDSNDSFYVSTPTDEENWLNKIAKDFGLDVSRTEEPTYDTAPCGALVTKLSHHKSGCDSCQQVLHPGRNRSEIKQHRTKGTPKPIPAGKNGPVETIVHVPELAESGMSLDGMIEVLRQRSQQAIEIASECEEAINAIMGIRERTQEVEKLSQQIEQDRQALRFFFREEVEGAGAKN